MVANDAVASLAGLIALLAVAGAFFWSLFNRLEGLFADLSLVHLWSREHASQDWIL